MFIHIFFQLFLGAGVLGVGLGEFRKRTQIRGDHRLRRELILFRRRRGFLFLTFHRMERRRRSHFRRLYSALGRDFRQTEFERDERQVLENDKRKLRIKKHVMYVYIYILLT